MNHIVKNIITASVLCSAAFTIGRTSVSDPPPCPAPRVGVAEVTELLARLRPLVRDPQGRYFNGLEVTFTPVRVGIIVRLPDYTDMKAEGPTLGAAVARLGKPTDDIRRALEGWSAP